MFSNYIVNIGLNSDGKCKGEKKIPPVSKQSVPIYFEQSTITQKAEEIYFDFFF